MTWNSHHLPDREKTYLFAGERTATLLLRLEDTNICSVASAQAARQQLRPCLSCAIPNVKAFVVSGSAREYAMGSRQQRTAGDRKDPVYYVMRGYSPPHALFEFSEKTPQESMPFAATYIGSKIKKNKRTPPSPPP